MDCTRYEELMSAALDGELSAGERRELDRHLAQCPACAELFDELREQSAALRGLDCRLPDSLHDRILKDLPPQEKPAPRPAAWRQWAALCACLVLVAAGIFALTRTDMPGGGTAAPVPAPYSNGDNLIPEARDGDSAGVEPDHYFFANDQYLRVSWGHTAPPGAQIVGSAAELAELLDCFPLDDLSGVAEQYGEEFFRAGRLLAVVLEEPSGSIRHRLAPQGLLWDQVTIQVRIPEVGTCDMAAWLILAEVGTSFDGGDRLDVVYVPVPWEDEQ